MRGSRKALFLTLFLLGAIIQPFLAIVPQVRARATVATSTTHLATAYGFQRKGFYAEGLFWAFYTDGTNAGWEFSSDGTTWTGAFTSIGSCVEGPLFSVWFDGTYFHYVRYNDYDLFYRRGTPVNNGTINWCQVEQLVYDGGVGDDYQKPCISVDSNGYAWIGAWNDQPDGDDYPFVLKNAKNDGTWSLDLARQLNMVDSLSWRVCPVPLTDGKVYVIYCRNFQSPYGRLYDAGFGGEESNLADYDIVLGARFSVVAYGDDVHFIYLRDTINQIRHNLRTFGVGWGEFDVLVQDSVTSSLLPALSIDSSTNTLYCFWTSTDTDRVYYKKYSSGSWDAEATFWIDESTDDIQYDYLISSFYEEEGGYIGLLYVTGLESPYNVQFAPLYIDVPPPLLPYTKKFETFSITADAVWTDYDLFTNLGVPKGAVAEIVCVNKDLGNEWYAGVRTDGSGIDRRIQIQEAEGGGVATGGTMLVKCDSSTGLIECYSQVATNIDFYLLGYFAGCDFTEAFTDMGLPPTTSVWTDKDLSGYGVPANAVVQVLMGSSAETVILTCGVRENGSVLERKITLDEAEYGDWSLVSIIVKADENSIIEWLGDVGDLADKLNMWVLGWFSSDVDFIEGWTDYAPTEDDLWESKTISEAVAGSVVAFALVHEDSGAETFCGLRDEGSVLARMIEAHEQEGGGFGGFQACILLDDYKKCEVYCEDASEALFYYTGYFIVILPPLKPNIPSLVAIIFNTTIAETGCSIYAEFFDTEGLYGYIFWNNATSPPGGVNSSFTSMTGTSNSTQENVTLPSSGTLFGCKYYVNDTDGYWGRDTLAMFPTASVVGDTVIMGASGVFWIILIIIVPIVAYGVKRR